MRSIFDLTEEEVKLLDDAYEELNRADGDVCNCVICSNKNETLFH